MSEPTFDPATVLDSLQGRRGGSPRRFSEEEAATRKKISMQASSDAKTALANLHPNEYNALRREAQRRRLTAANLDPNA